jgi:hypothetical protein
VRLELEVPPHWKQETVGGVRVVTAGYRAVPHLFIEVHPLVPRRQLDVDALLVAGVPADAKVARAAPVVQTTRTGWPMTLIEAVIGTTETRLLARYDILVLAGVVLVRALDRERLARKRSDILHLLASARPDLTTDAPARIGDLWDMGPGEGP